MVVCSLGFLVTGVERRGAMANAEVFDSYFRRADLNKDGRISGQEAVAFFQGAGLPQMTLAKVRWLFNHSQHLMIMHDEPCCHSPPFERTCSVECTLHLCRGE